MKKLSLLIPAIGLFAAFNASADVVQEVESFFTAPVPTRLLGDSASPAEATRTIAITPDIRYVNVDHGDVVDFKTADGGQFAIHFDGAPSAASFDLRRLAPDGALDHEVTVYVARGDDLR